MNIKDIIKNKKIITPVIITVLFLFILIINAVIKSSIYETNDKSFFANFYAKITNMPAFKINSDKISYIEYNKLFDYLKNFYNNQKEKNKNFNIPNDDIIKNEVKNKIIKDTIILKLANKYEISIKDREMFDEIKRLNEKTGSLDNTKKSIQEMYGIDLESFKKYFLEPIILKNKLNYFVSNDKKINKTKEQKINDILNEIKQSNNAIVKNKLGQEIDTFSMIAKDFSEDVTSAENMGDVGWVSSDRIDKDIYDVAIIMNIGDISNIIKSIDGYRIIKLTNKVINVDTPKIRFSQIFVKSYDADEYIKEYIQNAKIKEYIK